MNPTTQDIELALIDMDVLSRPVDEAVVKERAESIEAHGLQSPISVYRKPESDRFTLGYGAHRLAAHRLLGRTHITAIVHEPASHQEIRLAQAIENVQRHQMSPIEEAEACQVIIDAQIESRRKADSSAETGGELEEWNVAVNKAASMLGVTPKWLQGRLALNRLSPRVQQMLRDGLIHLAHAQVLARLASREAQEEIAGRAAAKDCQWGDRKGERGEPEPVHRVKDWVEEQLRNLDSVSWKLDVEFAGKPACTVCPHNSANAPGLFEGGESAAADSAPKKAQCLLATCFAEKSRVAGLGVRKASNTLVKLGLPKTAKGAEQAIEEREVAFVQPSAVVAMSKQAITPSKPTPAEKRGRQSGAQDQKAQQQKWENESKLRNLVSAWEDGVDNLIGTKVYECGSVSCCYLMLVMQSNAFGISEVWGGSQPSKKVKDGRAALDVMLKRVPTATWGDLDKFSTVLRKEYHSAAENHRIEDCSWPLNGNPERLGSYSRAKLVEVMEIDAPPMPTMADLEKASKPAAETEVGPEEKTSGKAKSRKKAKKSRGRA